MAAGSCRGDLRPQWAALPEVRWPGKRGGLISLSQWVTSPPHTECGDACAILPVLRKETGRGLGDCYSSGGLRKAHGRYLNWFAGLWGPTLGLAVCSAQVFPYKSIRCLMPKHLLTYGLAFMQLAWSSQAYEGMTSTNNSLVLAAWVGTRSCQGELTRGRCHGNLSFS